MNFHSFFDNVALSLLRTGTAAQKSWTALIQGGDLAENS